MIKSPLYKNIATVIETRISSGAYQPDEALPTEPMLGKEFGVSRITVRKGLAELKQKGLLYSRSGKGTMVRSDALVPQSMKTSGSIADLLRYAEDTVYLPIERAFIAPSPLLAEKLSVDRGEDVLRMSGTRSFGDRRPFAFEEIYVPKAFSAGLNNFELEGRTVFSTIEKQHGVSVGEVRQVVTAVMPNSRVREALGLSEKECCLRIVRAYIGRDNRPLQLAVVHYDSTKFEHTTVIYAD